MERPSLNPSVHLEAATYAAPARKSALWIRVLRRTWQVLVTVVKVGITPIPGLSRAHEAEEHSPVVRFMRGLVYRMAAVPVVLAVIVAAMVYTATHPVVVPAVGDPSSLGLYFERVPVVASDGVVSEGWLVPVVDARRVLEHKEDVLVARHAGAVLVHDHAYSRQQLLPYLRPLHEAGIVTLTVAVRGGGTSDGRGRTFGLRESLDVAAAVSVLRSRTTTDDERISVLGLGTGATAALLAARADPSIAAVAAIDPARDAPQLLAEIGPRQSYLAFLKPMVHFAFETVYNVDPDDADLARLTAALRDRQVLYVLSDHQTLPAKSHVRTVAHFLETRLSPPTTEASIAP